MKSSRAERARQFQPFDALEGIKFMYETSEKTVEEKRELSEERAAALNAAIAELEKGSLVRATYYDTDGYTDKEGILTEVNADSRYIKIVREKIAFDDLYELVLKK